MVQQQLVVQQLVVVQQPVTVVQLVMVQQLVVPLLPPRSPGSPICSYFHPQNLALERTLQPDSCQQRPATRSVVAVAVAVG